MPFLSGTTKTVSVYGRKAEVRVVNRHNDLYSFANDENDPFGFFPSQPKPKATYASSTASGIPSQLLSHNVKLHHDARHKSMSSLSASDESERYATADSSASFHSATSSTSDQLAAHQSNSTSSQRKALSPTKLNIQSPKSPKPNRSPSKRSAIVSRSKRDQDAILATPKPQRRASKRPNAASPQTIRKPSDFIAKDPMATSTVPLPLESTPPQSQPVGRAPRRAAQAARMAIQDYDFTDRDLTPRRPVPTKSYFAEKARQRAELVHDDKHGTQSRKRDSRDTAASSSRNASRKPMAPRPRHTSALATSMSSVVSISDSSMTSATTASDASFDPRGTDQSSFSLAGPSSDESFEPVRKRSAAAAAKAKQNKRVTRRIVATSDDEEDHAGHDDDGSDAEVEQDPAVKLAAQVARLTVAEGGSEACDSYLSEVLASVSQTHPGNFSDVIKQLRSSTEGAHSRVRIEKIGEASYSEVFKIFASTTTTSSARQIGPDCLVLKIIPIGNSSTSHIGHEGEDVPFCSPAADVEREIRLMQLMECDRSGSEAFVSLRSAHVVKGAYPAALLQAWDRWDAKRRARTGEGAENIRPDVLGSHQAYALLVMTDGGTDLESLKVKSWLRAASIFWQVVAGIAEMESRYEFEHRDLHWGNILVQTVAQDSCLDQARPSRRQSSARSASKDGGVQGWLLDSKVSGVKATIIDLTLSRSATTTSKAKGRKKDILYYPFDDECLFEGTGDPQFDVYREMRLVTGNDWQTFTPSTNLLWLRYLAHKLIDVKCKAVTIPKSAAESSSEAQLERQAYLSLQTASQRLDRAVEGLLNAASKRTAVARRKSLYPKARDSTFSAAAVGGTRRARATMAAKPLLPDEGQGDFAAIRSVAQFLTLVDQ